MRQINWLTCPILEDSANNQIAEMPCNIHRRSLKKKEKKSYEICMCVHISLPAEAFVPFSILLQELHVVFVHFLQVFLGSKFLRRKTRKTEEKTEIGSCL